MGNLINSVIGNSDSASQVSLLAVIISAIIPMGQFFIRIFWLDGSLDKIWTMFPLLWFFPFSIIPSLLMYNGYIKKEKYGKPYDNFVLIPIIAKFILSLVLSIILGIDDNMFITLAGQLLLGMIPSLIRASDVCDKFQKSPCKDLTFKSIGKALVDSTIANGVGELLPMLLGFLPIIGPMISTISMLPIIGSQFENIVWSMGFFITYVFINIINVNFMDKYCKPAEYLGKDMFDKIGFIIMLCATIGVKIYNSVM